MNLASSSWRRVVAAVSGATVLVGSVVLAAPAVGRPTVPAGPDLVISSIRPVGIGAPQAHLVIGPSGVAIRFDLRVVTRNIGTKVAPPSSTLVFLRDAKDKKAVAERRPVPSLKPGEYWIQVFQIGDYKPPLGFAHAIAVADFTKKVAESRETNNSRASESIAVIARIWDVEHFSTTQSLPSLTVTTAAQDGFYFRFKAYDAAAETFDYTPVGDTRGIAIQTGTCTGNGHKDYPGPFSKGFFAISATLTTYGAYIPLSKLAPFIVTVTCLGGITYPGRFALQNLDTFVGNRLKPHMTPAERTLHDAVAESVEHLLFVWTFKARIHG